MTRNARLSILAALLLCAPLAARAGETLDRIRAAHLLPCAVITEASDETLDDTHGDLSALGTQFCRALAAAVLGDASRARLAAFPQAALAYAALARGDVAIIVGDTPNPGIERRYGAMALQPIFFDGQALMVHKDRGIASLKDLGGRLVCFISGTDAQTQLNRAAAAAHVRPGLFAFEEVGEMEAALVDGHCDAQTGDRSKLAGDRAQFHARSPDFEILPEALTLDPFAPIIRNSDPQWAATVNAVFFALVQAEQLSVSKANLDAARTSPDPLVRELVGSSPGLGWALRLDDRWAARALAAVGNYGDLLRATTGEDSPMRLPRGPNALADQGGLIWAPPIRP